MKVLLRLLAIVPSPQIAVENILGEVPGLCQSVWVERTSAGSLLVSRIVIATPYRLLRAALVVTVIDAVTDFSKHARENDLTVLALGGV